MKYAALSCAAYRQSGHTHAHTYARVHTQLRGLAREGVAPRGYQPDATRRRTSTRHVDSGRSEDLSQGTVVPCIYRDCYGILYSPHTLGNSVLTFTFKSFYNFMALNLRLSRQLQQGSTERDRKITQLQQEMTEMTRELTELKRQVQKVQHTSEHIE